MGVVAESEGPLPSVLNGLEAQAHLSQAATARRRRSQTGIVRRSAGGGIPWLGKRTGSSAEARLWVASR